MLPLLLVLGLFLFLTFVGQAVVALLRPRLGVLVGWFLSPTLGFSLLVVLLTRLNVWGMPVRTAGPWLTAGLAAFALGVFLWRRPVLPWRQLAPFAAVAAGCLLYMGWPALAFGFRWISYGNDDMANYCLAAQRFLEHGYYAIPMQTDLEGRDYTQHYWFMHALQQIRPGSELTIAWAASVTGLRAQQAFMPVILMLSLLVLFALGAMALHRGRDRRVALLAFFLLATSPLFALGTLYQLIAQVAGTAILLAASMVLLSASRLTARTWALAGLLTACLAIVYPEMASFVPLSIIIFGLKLRYRDPALFKRYCVFIGAVAALTFAVIASNTYQFINTLVMQSMGAAGLGAMTEINDQSGGLVLFPWTLVPTFVPMLFGLHPFGVVGFDPLRSAQIAVGFAFLGFLFWRIWRNLRDDSPTGFLGVNMALTGFYLFYIGQDFGLFKLAMWAQPVIAICLAQGFARLTFAAEPAARRRGLWVLAAFFCCTAPAYCIYSYASLGTYGGGLTEVPGASRLGVAFTPPKDLKYQGIESDISNVVTAKMLALHTQGVDTRFLSRSYMDNVANIAVLKFLRTPDPNLGPQARLMEKLAMLRFMLPPELMQDDVPDYKVISIRKLGNDWTETSSRHLGYDDRLFVSVRPELDHFNKANPGTGWTTQHMYQYKLESQVSDRLVFIHSELSPHYYSAARFKASFFQREPEPITGGKVYFHGTGQYTLFKIIRPSPDLRVMVDFTRTPLGGERSYLPNRAVVVGDEDYRLPFVGHGSARVVSPVIKPEVFEKESYFTIDFGEMARPIPTPKTGLMMLFGRKYNLDDRRLVGFTRDISVLTDEQYRALPRPSRIADFPWDLYKYRGLEYSGLFEDGWVSGDAYVKLAASHPGQVLRFRGYVPDVPSFRTAGEDLTISINDKPTEVVHLKAGEFTLTRLIKEPADITSVSLHFSDAQIYNGENDNRPLSAFVREIAIDDSSDLADFRRFSAESGGRFDVKGADTDGWMGREADLRTPAYDAFKVLKVDLEMPGWAPLASNGLKVSLDGAPRESDAVPRGTYQSLFLPLPAGTRHVVELRAGADFPLPGGGRRRAFRIKNISVEDLSRTDLFVRGWHPSGYQFGIEGADSDGWVDRRMSLRFPATARFKAALVDVVRFPAHGDLPLEVRTDGASQSRMLGLEKTERVRVPLSASAETRVELAAPDHFPLAAPDTRARSYRVVGIDFE